MVDSCEGRLNCAKNTQPCITASMVEESARRYYVGLDGAGAERTHAHFLLRIQGFTKNTLVIVIFAGK